MQETATMHKSPIPVRHLRMNQARLKEEEKERETGKTEPRRLMERNAAQENKNLSKELKGTAQIYKAGGRGSVNFP